MPENYTKISNDILDALPKAKLNGTQYAICLVIWRYTFGFHRCEAKLSASFIAEATDSNHRQIKRELQALIERNIVQSIDSRQGVTSILKFNKDISSWQLVSKKTPVKPVSNSPLVTNQTPVLVSNSPPELVSNSPPKKERKKDKENIYSISAQKIFATWNEQGITIHKTITEDIGKAIDAALKKYGLEKVALAIQRYSKIYHDSDYFFSYKWTLVNFLNRKKVIPDFLDGGEKWENYLARGQPKNKDSTVDDLGDPVPGAQDRTPI
jgi:phage replication O-like protein O